MNLNRLDLNLLVALDALLAEHSITKASERLHLSPSATSGALSRLREFFDDKLLTQIGRKMVPTPLGELLRTRVRDCLLHIQSTVEIRPDFDPTTSRRKFILMMSDYVSTVLMPRVLPTLQTTAPGITIELLANDDQPWETLERGEVDLLVLPENFTSRDHPRQLLFQDDFVCLCWAENQLVNLPLTQEQFFALSHAIVRLGRQRPPTIDAWFFERYGHHRRVEVVAMNFTSLPHLLIGTQRIATVHRRLATIYSRLLPLKMIESPVAMPPLQEMVQWHRYRDQDPARIWLTNLLVEAMTDPVAPPST